MQFGHSSSRKRCTRSLKPNIFENSCQGEDFQKLLLQCYRVDSKFPFNSVTLHCYGNYHFLEYYWSLIESRQWNWTMAFKREKYELESHSI